MKLFKLFVIFVSVYFAAEAVLSLKAQPQDEPGRQNISRESLEAEASKERRAITERLPLMEIQRLEAEEPKYSIELRQVSLQDFFRLVSHNYGLNIIADDKIKGNITASFTNVSLDEALEVITRRKGLKMEKKGRIIIIEPDLITEVISLMNISLDSVLEEGSCGTQAADGKSNIFSLLSEHGRIIPSRQTNSLVVMDYPRNLKKVKGFLEAIDMRLATKAVKLDYISVKDLFPELMERERQIRAGHRRERGEERSEIEGMKN